MYGAIYDWYTLEGPAVRHHDGAYYCFYSGGSWLTEGYRSPGRRRPPHSGPGPNRRQRRAGCSRRSPDTSAGPGTTAS